MKARAPAVKTMVVAEYMMGPSSIRTALR